MQPSVHAIEILKAITNGQDRELGLRLGRAGNDCLAAVGLTAFEKESFELLETCVEALQSHDISTPRGKAAVQILLHLAGTVWAEPATLSPVRGNSQSATVASFRH